MSHDDEDDWGANVKTPPLDLAATTTATLGVTPASLARRLKSLPQLTASLDIDRSDDDDDDDDDDDGGASAGTSPLHTSSYKQASAGSDKPIVVSAVVRARVTNDDDARQLRGVKSTVVDEDDWAQDFDFAAAKPEKLSLTTKLHASRRHAGGGVESPSGAELRLSRPAASSRVATSSVAQPSSQQQQQQQQQPSQQQQQQQQQQVSSPPPSPLAAMIDMFLKSLPAVPRRRSFKPSAQAHVHADLLGRFAGMSSDEREHELRAARRDADARRASGDVRGYITQLVVQGVLHVADNQLAKCERVCRCSH